MASKIGNVTGMISIKTNIDKIVSIIALSFILLAQITVINTPLAAGYEISLYEAYPYYLWYFILLALSCGICLLIYHAFSNDSSKWWIAGFIICLYVNIIISILPFCRGYITFGRGDVLSHIGYIKDILFTGHYAAVGLIGNNYYPVVHIIGTDVSLLTELTPELLAEILPVFFTSFYIVSVHLLSRKIALRWGEILLITAFGSLLLFEQSNIMISPSIFCFYLLPFNLFLINERQSSHKRLEFSIILILMLIMIPFLHPGEGTIFLALFILSLKLSRLLYLESNRRLGNGSAIVYAPQSLEFIYPMLILSITWFAWLSSYSAFARAIRSVWNWLMNEIGTTTAMEYGAMISLANLTPSEFIHLLLNIHGQALVYFIVGFMIIIVSLRKFFYYNGKIDQMQFTYSLLFIIFGILLFIAFFSKAIWLDYNREMIYVIFAATILNGFGLYEIFHRRHRKIGAVCVAIILMTAASFSLFNTFPSPIVMWCNSQVTTMEVVGMGHFIDRHDDAFLIDNLGINQKRFAHCLVGVQNLPQNISLQAGPEDHFGYDKNESYGQSYIDDRYFIESKLSRILYPETAPEYKQLWRFTPEDFSHLDRNDTSASRIYCNGEFWAYYIKGEGG